jgi:hypothetical protein
MRSSVRSRLAPPRFAREASKAVAGAERAKGRLVVESFGSASQLEHTRNQPRQRPREHHFACAVLRDARVRDLWHRKEEIDPSLDLRSNLQNTNHYLQDISALAHRDDERVVNVLVGEAWPPHHRVDLTKQAGLSNQCPSATFAFIEGARFEVSTSKADVRKNILPSVWTLIMRAIKCLKGVRWMPWRWEAMKDVLRCDKPWGAAKKLWSTDFRMGKPTFDSWNSKAAHRECDAWFWISSYQVKVWDLWIK